MICIRHRSLIGTITLSLGLAAGACLADQAGDWEAVHMVSFATVEDFPTLKAHGVNVVLLNVTHDPAHWQKCYDAAAREGLRLVPVLWGIRQTAWRWNDRNGEWELDAARYPNSVGARFLQFLRADPARRAATFALYSFHEPHNPEGDADALVPPERLRQFRRQIRNEQFPQPPLKIYGESVAWHRDCRNGCVDYEGLSLYPFAAVDGRAQYRPLHWAVAEKGLGGMEIWPAPPTADRQRAMANGRAVIDSLHALIQQTPPAPDGGRTRLIVLIQTYSIDGRADLWNRMPSAGEMTDWATHVIGQRKEKLAGLSWYCCRKAANFYTRSLADDRIDADGQDRMEAVSNAARALLTSPDRPPGPTTQPDPADTRPSPAATAPDLLRVLAGDEFQCR